MQEMKQERPCPLGLWITGLGQTIHRASLRLGWASWALSLAQCLVAGLTVPLPAAPPHPQRLKARSGTSPKVREGGGRCGRTDWASVFTILFVASFSLVS
jgi:hypothetical protein